MAAHDVLDDRQPKPRPGKLSRLLAFHAIEPLCEARQMDLGDAGPAVHHPNGSVEGSGGVVRGEQGIAERSRG